MTRAQEILIQSIATQLRALANSLLSLIAREEPEDVIACPKCHSKQISEAGDDLVCADCNHNFKP